MFLLKYSLIFFIYFAIPGVSPSKILFISPLGTRSETIKFKEIIHALASKDHSITWITPTQYKDLPNDKVIQYSPITVDEFTSGFTNPIQLRQMVKDVKWTLTRTILDFPHIYDLCHKIYQTPKFMSIFESKYDLVIISGLVNDCFMGLVHKLGSPFIFITSTVSSNQLTWQIGNYLPPSTVPNTYLTLSDQMNFPDRFYNTIQDWLGILYHKYITLPKHEAVYRKYLGVGMPSIEEIQSNASLILSSSHFTLHAPKPLYPDMIEIGGAHCRPPRPLPDDLEAFFKGASHGVVYFSLGSILKGSDFDDTFRNIFLNVFGRLAPTKVLWKWETDMPKGVEVPSNVKLVKWSPQQDILGHNNTKLFITHGGTLSLQEAIMHGVPLLGFPVFFDQDANLAKLESAGFAIKMELLEVNEKDLETNIRRVLTEPGFQKTAKKLSAQFRDQPESPLQRTIFWIEYVIRHQGAPQLRSSSRNLNLIQYLSLDIIAILLLFIYAFYAIGKSILFLIWKSLFEKNIKIKTN